MMRPPLECIAGGKMNNRNTEPSSQELQQRLLEAGLISEIKPPITDLTPYQNRQAIPVQGSRSRKPSCVSGADGGGLFPRYRSATLSDARLAGAAVGDGPVQLGRRREEKFSTGNCPVSSRVVSLSGDVPAERCDWRGSWLRLPGHCRFRTQTWKSASDSGFRWD